MNLLERDLRAVTQKTVRLGGRVVRMLAPAGYFQGSRLPHISQLWRSMARKRLSRSARSDARERYSTSRHSSHRAIHLSSLSRKCANMIYSNRMKRYRRPV
ncbi:hypothetical protein B0G84_1908 [Paraburkholderia sp. BL8N3]|nr:hypothetical protein B0G84_1908 [Paraburkholderia sp. BL8N3]